MSSFIQSRGMMYCMDSKKQSLENAVSQIVLRSIKRINKSPEILEVHPSMIPGQVDQLIAGIRLVAKPGIAPGHFFQAY